MQILLFIPALFFIFFLPGVIWSFVFFGKKGMENMERIVFSFAFSIAVIPLVVFYTDIFGISITTLTVIIQTILVILIAIFILVIKKLKNEN